MIEVSEKDLETRISRVARLLSDAGCTEVYLAGSALRGELGRYSDLDFAVRGIPAESFFRLMSIASDIVGRAVDFIDLDAGEPIAQHLASSGEMKRVA